MDGWRFDPISGLIGAVLALVLAGLAYLSRESLAGVTEQPLEVLRNLLAKVTADTEHRYRESLVEWASKLHIFAELVPLEQVFVHPPLVPLPPFPVPGVEKPIPPRAPSLGAIMNGHPRVAILGEPASGRTTLLAYLSIVFARGEAGQTLGAYLERLPLYISLPLLDWPAVEGQEQDVEEKALIEWLVNSALTSGSVKSAHTGTLKNNLSAGTALVLFDGWDELEPDQQSQAAAWLGTLADNLTDNIWVVTAGPSGFAQLTAAMFVPVRLGEWENEHARALVDSWDNALQPAEDEEAQDTARLDRNLLAALHAGATPMELAVRCWSFFVDGTMTTGRARTLVRATEQMLNAAGEDPDWALADVLAAVNDVALLLQKGERTDLSLQELDEALEAVMPPKGERHPQAKEQAIKALTAPGSLLRTRDGESYSFPHPLWHSSLAAQQMADLPPATLLEHLEDSAWAPMVDYYAEYAPMEPVIEVWLSQPDDLWHTRLCRAARWVSASPPDAQWRNGVMALLARTFLNPELLLPIRQRIARALINTNDPGVLYLFKQSVQHPEPEIRVAVLKALGQLGREADVEAFRAALEDPEPRVRAAATSGLGAMANEAALELLTQLLYDAEQEIRVDAANGLARFGEEGWQALKEALKAEDLLTRRAAVFGLGSVEQTWVREVLLDVSSDDTEWVVRSAADSVIEMMEQEQTQPAPVVEPPPQISEAGWLISWAAERGESVGLGEAAFRTVALAAQEGDPETRVAAIWALGMLGSPDQVLGLRQIAEDEDPKVASAALEALEELCRRHAVTVK
jgi:HEAT repeat protein